MMISPVWPLFGFITSSIFAGLLCWMFGEPERENNGQQRNIEDDK